MKAYKQSLPLRGKYFLYVGNAYPHKNLVRAIEAVVALNRSLDQKVVFKIVSSRNIFTSRLEKVIHKFKAQEFVELLGYVPDDKLEVLYKNATGFLYPSTYEGFGLPGLEAMKCGTIVLASDISVFKEVYENHAIYFDPYSINSICKSLKETIKMPRNIREKKIREAQKFVKRYSWSKMAQETLTVYKNI